MYQRILVPLDGSAVAEAAIEVACRLLAPGQGELLLVRMQEYSKEANSSDSPLLSDVFDGEHRRCEDYLELVGDRFREDHKVAHRVLDHQLRTARVLAGTAETYDCDLVVLTSHGRCGLERALMGSVAEDVARVSTRPVLILGPQTAEVRRIKDEIQALSKR